MDRYLQLLQQYFKKYHVGDKWSLPKNKSYLLWTLERTKNGYIWVEVTHNIIPKPEKLFIQIATNDPSEVERINRFANYLPQPVLNYNIVKPDVADGWARVGYYLYNPGQTDEWFALISHIANMIGRIYLQNKS